MQYVVKSWIFWTGISFVIGGVVSLAINLSVGENFGMFEDLKGYSFGWIVVGVGFIIYSMLKNLKGARP